jgi:hypothetical protein
MHSGERDNGKKKKVFETLEKAKRETTSIAD